MPAMRSSLRERSLICGSGFSREMPHLTRASRLKPLPQSQNNNINRCGDRKDIAGMARSCWWGDYRGSERPPRCERSSCSRCSRREACWSSMA